MAQKPSIPKGTRDFGPEETARRNYIFDTIRQVFRLYGFRPIETPAMENLSTLMGKYGEEGDKLLFKILNSGNYLSGVDTSAIDPDHLAPLTSVIAEKGLRYDLTVPFARFVVQHRSDINLPFKRYQIQPVWRADRPQKGRYREFFQCDADIVGSTSLVNEAQLLAMASDVFSQLKINVVIKLNNRKVLAGIAEMIGHPDKLTDITVAIDKLDKIGLEAVCGELRERGVDPAAIERLTPVITLTGSTDQRLDRLQTILSDSEQGTQGVAELRSVLALAAEAGVTAPIELDVALARGLNYYTGTIIEVKATDVAIGSISGGGRYDNLTGVFGMDGLSGVGISFGADRIYDVLTALSLFPQGVGCSADIMFVNLGDNELRSSLKTAAALRSHGISAEVYPDCVKMKKQLAYAAASAIRFVGIIGSDELTAGTMTLRDMHAGEQETLPLPQAIDKILANINH